ncbi:MAG: glycosyltransferase [Proteobacteria bacterium]|nr:glycosyltransferase [Pseudomonadota bacterium]
MSVLFWLSIISLGLTLAVSLEIALGMKRMTYIKDVPPADSDDLPKVSIIIPACNEADTMEPALQSVLALDYPDLEIIVINDRSTDRTADVLKGMQHKHSRIKIHEITELPPGWMGKLHALQYGADHAKGEYLLFTDADIVFEKSTLRRAVGHVLKNRLDHLSMFFENKVAGGILNALFLDVGGGLLMLFKPWKAKDKKSKKFMGVGAFNMVKASAYGAIGGHSAFAMHPIDDIMLGKVLKERGFAQDCIIGEKFLQVKWYGTVRDLIDGVMKNTFAVYDFSVPGVLAGCTLIFVMNILPLWGVIITTGTTRLIFGAAVLFRLMSLAHGFSHLKMPLWNSVWGLVTPYINIYLSIKAAVLTLRHNGISWRGTHYSLDEMKKQGGLF